MTQYDVDKVLAIEKDISIKLDEIKFNETKVLEEMATVTKAIKKIKLVKYIHNLYSIQKMIENGTTDLFLKKQKEKKEQKEESKMNSNLRK